MASSATFSSLVPAHAGARHMDGRSAIREMAHIILKLEALTDYDKGQTCSVGIINGGTLTNVVPEDCTISVDIRIPDMDAAEKVMAFVAGLQPEDKDCVITVEGGVDRPPYEKFEGIEKLFEHAKKCAAEIGFELKDLKTRELPALDDDFAKQAGEKDTLKELRSDLEQRLKDDAERRELRLDAEQAAQPEG